MLLSIGTVVAILGLLVSVSALLSRGAAFRWQNVIAALLLLVGAAVDHHLYFVALEAVILFGAALAFTSLRATAKFVLMLGGAAVAVAVCITWSVAIGVVSLGGLVVLAAGNALESKRLLLAGGCIMLLYCWLDFTSRGAGLSLVFLCLQAVYVRCGVVEVFFRPKEH